MREHAEVDVDRQEQIMIPPAAQLAHAPAHPRRRRGQTPLNASTSGVSRTWRARKRKSRGVSRMLPNLSHSSSQDVADHIPVMAHEVAELLELRRGTVVDCPGRRPRFCDVGRGFSPKIDARDVSRQGQTIFLGKHAEHLLAGSVRGRHRHALAFQTFDFVLDAQLFCSCHQLSLAMTLFTGRLAILKNATIRLPCTATVSTCS